MLDQNTIVVTWVVVRCGACDTRFKISKELHDDLVRTKQTWHCPVGHVRIFRDGDERDRKIQQLQNELESANSRAARQESQIRSLKITKGKVEAKLRRTETRIHAGVCPHCNRTFQNVARHMRTKHPEKVAETHHECATVG